MSLLSARSSRKHGVRHRFWAVLGPGLITGASDDDPSGIATYSQVGAHYGYGMAWLMPFSYPLMVGIQEISARIGRVTGRGIAGNLRRCYPAWLLHGIVVLLLFANIINLGADLGAMGDVLALLVGGPKHAYVAAFALLCAGAEIFFRYQRYVALLKWITLSLLAYVATVLVAGVDWREAALRLVVPGITWEKDYIVGLVAVLGTTISPYLFFWQAAEEAEDERVDRDAGPLVRRPEQAPAELRRIRLDTAIGMGFSNFISLCIIVTTAATLHGHGVGDVQTSAQAAEALRPIAGAFASAVFAAGIIGTGLLAVPVLAGSAAYAVGEALKWPTGLGRRPLAAKAFYATIGLVTLIGIGINFVAIDPTTALYWSAVINGVIAVPLMAVMMLMAAEPKVMGRFILPRGLRILGWAATAVMCLTVLAMFGTWLW